jgi:leucine efflux protein
LIHITQFVAASVAVILLPGPGQIAILTATLSGGWKSGLKAVAGLVTGDLCIMALTALGVATVFRMYPGSVRILRLAGGLCIGWIGLRVLFSRLGALTAVEDVRGEPRWYLRTVGITLLNPKAILFFVSFFPLFMDPTMGVVRSFLQMGVIFTALSGSYLILFSWMGSRLSRWLQSSAWAAVWVPRTLGAIILGFGSWMLLE